MKTVMLAAAAVLALMVNGAQATSIDADSQSKLRGGSCDSMVKCPRYSKPKIGVSCVEHVSRDCECDQGYAMDAFYGKCECLNNYICPIGSERIPGRLCYNNFHDCQCKPGFERHGDECVCVADYQCPVNSHRKPNRYCYNDLSDCECDEGYWMQYGECVKKPECNYICPKGSHRTVAGCPYDFSDCKCKSGYERKGDKCVPVCNYSCPAYSKPKHGVECPSSAKDCECEQGYWMGMYGTCECRNDYICPIGSERIPGRSCYNNFDDCRCKDGFKRRGGECICDADYQCPANSHRKPNRHCYNDISDCECDEGYWMQYGECVKKPVCNYICPKGSHRTTSGCPYDFSDCKCKPGYERKGHECVEMCKYTCPKNSIQITRSACPTDESHCRCNDNYIMVDGQCLWAVWKHDE